MHVTREKFAAFIAANPHLTPIPVEGRTIAAMQYVDSQNRVMAQAIYSRPVQANGVKVIPAYTITEESK